MDVACRNRSCMKGICCRGLLLGSELSALLPLLLSFVWDKKACVAIGGTSLIVMPLLPSSNGHAQRMARHAKTLPPNFHPSIYASIALCWLQHTPRGNESSRRHKGTFILNVNGLHVQLQNIGIQLATNVVALPPHCGWPSATAFNVERTSMLLW